MKTVDIIIAAVGLVVCALLWEWQCKADGGYPHSGARPDCSAWCDDE